MSHARLISFLAALPFVALAVGCSAVAPSSERVESEPVDAVSLSARCDDTVSTFLATEEKLYDTHPVWDAEIPGTNASADEHAAYDALLADEEAQWAAAFKPVYTACESPAEWWLAANKYPGMAGLTDATYLKPSDIETYCYDRMTDPMCTGVEDWLATNPD